MSATERFAANILKIVMIKTIASNSNYQTVLVINFFISLIQFSAQFVEWIKYKIQKSSKPNFELLKKLIRSLSCSGVEEYAEYLYLGQFSQFLTF